MRHYIAIGVSSALVLIFCAGAQAALIADYKLDEPSGNIVDSTGINPSGTPSNGPTYGAPGVPNGTYGAITVSGAAGTGITVSSSPNTQYFTIGTSNTTSVQNVDTAGTFTAMGWVNPSVPTASATYRMISTGSGSGADGGFGFGLRFAVGSTTTATLRYTSYNIADTDSSAVAITGGNWYHIAMTYSAGAVTYYFNGASVGTVTSAFNNETTNGRLTIGARAGPADASNAEYDGIRVYDTVLTPAQIQASASGAVTPEPSTLASLGVVGSLLLSRRRRRAV